MFSPKSIFIAFLLVLVAGVLIFPERTFANDDSEQYMDPWGYMAPDVQKRWIEANKKPAPADPGVVENIVAEFTKKSDGWKTAMKENAKKLLYWFAAFECTWIGIRLALGRENPGDAIKQLVMFILMAGFFLACINNYNEWSQNLIKGLAGMGDSMGASSKDAQQPFQAGLNIVTKIWGKLNAFAPIDSLGVILAGLVVLVCFALIAARMVLIQCEAAVAMAATLLLLGFGGSSLFKDYAVNTIRYILAVAFKLFVLQLIMSVGIEFINTFEVGSSRLMDLAVIIGASIVLVALVNTLPDTVAGIVTGSNIGGGSGAGLGAAAGAAVGAGAAVIGAGVGAVAAGGSLSAASKIASMAGATGLGKVGHMAKNLMSANSEANKNGGKRSDIMKERLAAATQAAQSPPSPPKTGA